MKSVIKAVILLVCILELSKLQSCKKLGLCKDDKFSFSRIEYSSNVLKLDGYYYGDVSGSNPNNSQVIFFYRNGICYNNGIAYATDSLMSGSIVLSSDRSTNAGWGIYKIENSSIEIQSWAHAVGCKPVLIEKGVILNDSTFKIVSWTNSNSDETNAVNAIFSFHKYSPKPDSTNNFID